MRIFVSLMCLTLVIIMKSVSVSSEPEPMARLTRPKVFTSPEELRRYLDVVKDYYSVNGKARYGKRSDQYVAPLVHDHPINLLKMILALGQQRQRAQSGINDRIESEEANKLHLIHPSDHATGIYEIFD